MYAEFYSLYSKYVRLGMPSTLAIEGALLSIERADLIPEAHKHNYLADILFAIKNSLDSDYSP